MTHDAWELPNMRETTIILAPDVGVTAVELAAA
jgi:hypothetical protein